MKTHLLLLASAAVLAACANTPGNTANKDAASNSAPAIDGSQQAIRVEVLGADGKTINGLTCRLANDYGYFIGKSGESVVVKRSGKDLDVSCEAPGTAEAKARLLPRGGENSNGGIQTSPNTSIFGQIGLGSGGSRGGVGVSIGFPIGGRAAAPGASAYRYPEWVQLQAGKTMLFDAAGSSAKQPAAGYIKP